MAIEIELGPIGAVTFPAVGEADAVMAHVRAGAQWTADPPAESGFYAYCDKTPGSEPVLVYVAPGDYLDGQDSGLGLLYADGKLVESVPGYWYGPIPSPPDAADLRIVPLPGEPLFRMFYRPPQLTAARWQRLVEFMDEHPSLDSALATETTCVVMRLTVVSDAETDLTIRQAVSMAINGKLEAQSASA